MLQLEELKQALLAQQPKIQDLREALGCDRLLEEKKKLDEEAASPDFWNDMENTRRVLKEQKVVNEKLDSYNSLVSMFEDAQTMVELAGEEDRFATVLWTELSHAVRIVGMRFFLVPIQPSAFGFRPVGNPYIFIRKRRFHLVV